MDERREPEDEHVEDLEPTADEAEDVKGGRGATGGTFTITFQGQTTSPAANNDPNQRGGWDGNHNQTLIGI